MVSYFDKLVCKYHPLITRHGLDSLGAVKVFNWKKFFQQPLIQPKGPPPGGTT